ncbi:PadR family transcriptional regulator [Sporomusa acidovorans]|uniref:Transcription regulator PadR N-terminal domain-containing protein n=1 Tax=Sporomusa acidovorans (strain ATCC 49682 / DSM 3132 / Mol) TaxID=1123286 RepID=A0ABZ3J0F2_SPOA4|nr:PadR family transcriptional regulator [Sporomusa acidovorans]SDF86027.1 transcriptional regulator, PadR family [Sporomusa acidovorans]
MNKKYGRHTPAFLLLFLAQKPSYGAALLAKMKGELPYCFADSAIVYRSLQDMEKQGLLETKWKIIEGGQPQKWYKITPKGISALADFAIDIKQRRENLDFFLARYNEVIKEEQN